MALPEFFKVRGYEVGGTKNGKLQYLGPGEAWTNLGGWAANEHGTVNIDKARNPIPVDYGLFTPGESYQFRLIDDAGSPISNVINFAFTGGPLLNIDGTDLTNIDGTDLINL